VIHRDEFTLMLMRLASQESVPRLDAKVQDNIKALLQKNGIQDPAGVLNGVHAAALELETLHPQLAGNIRREIAIVQVAGSDLVAKVHGSFDNVMDRASSRFTQYARYVTFVNGLLITLFLQLDTLSMVNRLSLDDSLRGAMVDQANQLTATVQQNAGAPDANAVDNSYINFLNRNGILWTPVSLRDWGQHWKWSRVSGILVSFLLINLGAPFWYNALKSLLRLRSAAEEKDDSQRSARQAIPPLTVPPLPPPVIGATQAPAPGLASGATTGG
jgi:hypothetical protein